MTENTGNSVSDFDVNAIAEIVMSDLITARRRLQMLDGSMESVSNAISSIDQAYASIAGFEAESAVLADLARAGIAVVWKSNKPAPSCTSQPPAPTRSVTLHLFGEPFSFTADDATADRLAAAAKAAQDASSALNDAERRVLDAEVALKAAKAAAEQTPWSFAAVYVEPAKRDRAAERAA
ncbi:hypothetical protein HNR60_001726 [Rhodopseudomonas rhenobacensis]|uniref:Uncharacterized protein n=1 Tax=Rhodopseudomonas rhenobacensis TaxID=87461 RepID=A0A7W7Z3F9_9BRAD|nr:hypothetical protein [Rhodopseudomonas rhenobacensis]MBB5046977.1 hypothetical protein [Rhodopseudomonas rhenobacensis]